MKGEYEMSVYHEDYVKKLICDRAQARRERANQREINIYANVVFVPFQQWLLYTHGIVDWKELPIWELRYLFCDYQCDCVRHQLEWEHPQNYGLDNVI